MTRGGFITFEGGEGAGKTVQIKKVKEYLESQGYDVIATREPGGVKVAEKIREVLIGPDVEDMDAITEVFLYAAARREHFKEVIQPAMDEGKIVLSDRFFDSSIVYQGLVKNAMKWTHILDINLKATEGKQPDLTIYFDIGPNKALSRIKINSDREVNRFDRASMDFHYQVRNSYRYLCECFPKRMKMINADNSIENVFNQCMNLINRIIEKPKPIVANEIVNFDFYSVSSSGIAKEADKLLLKDINEFLARPR